MGKNVVQNVYAVAEPLAVSLGYSLWDVEFIRDGQGFCLRLTIDKTGGVFIDDCEKMHRAIDPILDETDPIEVPYRLEVSSPGLGRQIKNAQQAGKCLNAEVNVKLYAPDESGRRTLRGKLTEWTDETFTLETADGSITTEIKKAAKVSLADDEL